MFFDLKRFRQIYSLKQSDVAKEFGIAQGTYSVMENNKRELTEEEFAVLLKRFGKNVYDFIIERDTEKWKEFFTEEQKADDIPLLPVDKYRDREVDLLEYVKRNVVSELPPIPQFPDIDAYYKLTGDSMMPDLRPGDYVGIRIISKDDVIMNGRKYVLDTQRLGTFMCCLFDNGEEYTCRFINDMYGEFSVPKSEVYNVMEAVGMYRLNV